MIIPVAAASCPTGCRVGQQREADLSVPDPQVGRRAGAACGFLYSTCDGITYYVTDTPLFTFRHWKCAVMIVSVALLAVDGCEGFPLVAGEQPKKKSEQTGAPPHEFIPSC